MSKHPLSEAEVDALVDEIQERLGDSTARKVGRRGVLAALGVAALGTGSASAQASGTVGTASNPVDVEGYDVTASNSFTDAAGVQHTGELADLSDVGSGTGQWQEVNSGANIEPIDGETIGTGVEDVDVGTLNAEQVPDNFVLASRFSDIQSAHDAVAAGGGTAEQALLLSPGIGAVSETVDITKTGLKTLAPGGTYPHIEGSGDHAVDVSVQDTAWDGGWIDQVDSSGSYDALHVSGAEFFVSDLDIDLSPRYGAYINSSRAELRGVQIQGGDTAGLYVGGGLGSHYDVTITGANGTGKGAVITSNKNTFDILITDQGGAAISGDGLTLDGSLCRGSVLSMGAGGDGVVIGGAGNVVDMAEFGSTGVGVRISGSDNIVYGRIDSNVVFESGSDNNDLTNAKINGTVTNNGGTGNVT